MNRCFRMIVLSPLMFLHHRHFKLLSMHLRRFCYMGNLQLPSKTSFARSLYEQLDLTTDETVRKNLYKHYRNGVTYDLMQYLDEERRLASLLIMDDILAIDDMEELKLFCD